MRKAVLGAYSTLIAGAVAFVIFPPLPLAVESASTPESLNKTIIEEEVQTFQAKEYEPIKLERSDYSATTSEELEAIKAAKAKKAAEEEAKKKAEEAAAREVEKATPQVASVSIPAPPYSGGGTSSEWMAAAGIAESDWGYVDYIVSKESSWNPNAVNASSGASGLVQALPCGKVPGNCFNPVDNLKWADGYAKGRYGSWAAAYDFWVTNHWW